MKLIVFTNTGHRYVFDDVENFTHTTQGFEFEFPDGRRSVFNYTSVAGFSIGQ